MFEGHAAFVAVSYAVSFLGLAGLVGLSLLASRRAARRLRALEGGK